MNRKAYIILLILFILALNAGESKAYISYFYTPKEAIIYGKARTPTSIRNSQGDVIWSGGNYTNVWSEILDIGQGNYSITSTGKVALLIGDAITGAENIDRGYYALTLNGEPCGTEFFTTLRGTTNPSDPHELVIFSYSNNNTVRLALADAIEGFPTIWQGELDKGEYYIYSYPYYGLGYEDLRVTSTHPVSVFVKTDYGHEMKYFIPSSSGTFSGTEFFGWFNLCYLCFPEPGYPCPPCEKSLYVIAYEEDTHIELINEIGQLIQSWDLDKNGIAKYPLSIFVVMSNFCTITSTKPITALFWGSTSKGMTYIPDKAGKKIGTEFVFPGGTWIKIFGFKDETKVDYYDHSGGRLIDSLTINAGENRVLNSASNVGSSIVISNKPISIMYISEGMHGATYVPIPWEVSETHPFCPGIIGVTHEPFFPNIEDKKIKIMWATDELADSCIIYRINGGDWISGFICTPPPFIICWSQRCSLSSDELTFDHELEMNITGLNLNDTVEYYIESKDTEGCTTIDNNNGKFYSFTASPLQKLEVSRDSVVDKGTYYTVTLRVENLSTDNVTDIKIRERLSGFLVTTEIPENCQDCQVRLKVLTDPQIFDIQNATKSFTNYFNYIYDVEIQIPEVTAQTSLLISYDIVPILYGSYDTYSISVIPGRNTVTSPTSYSYKDSQQKTYFHDLSDPYIFNPQDVFEKIRYKDYVIATDPYSLIRRFGNHSSKVLQKAAQFVLARDGVIGSLDSGSKVEIEELIDSSWNGRKERYYNDGDYLLFIGEEEIVPSWKKSWSCKNYCWWEKVWYGATIADNEYADVKEGDNHKPELIIGRLPGEDAASYIKLMDNCLSSIFKTKAVFMSGIGDGEDRMKETINDVYQSIKGMYLNPVSPLHWVNYQDHENPGDKIRVEFQRECNSADLIICFAHGAELMWWPYIDSNFVQNLNFIGKNPIIISISCHTGNIAADNSLAQAFLNQGASVFIGSTQISSEGQNSTFLKKMAGKWAEGGNSIGYCFKWAKRELMDRSPRNWYNCANCRNRRKYKRIVNEYNLYGDPKRSPPITELSRARLKQVYGPPLSTINFTVPEYEVDREDGIDYVSLPGDGTFLIDYEPIVPIYIHKEYIGALYKIQNVSLIDRFGKQTGTGLNLPIEMPDPNIDEIYTTPQATSPIFPDPQDIFHWEAIERFDGNHELIIVVYPFYYNKETTEVEFWKNYSFSIEYAESSIEIVTIEKGNKEYMPGDLVRAIVTLQNHGQEDIHALIKTDIFNEADDKVGEGTSINIELYAQGETTVEVEWDSNGLDPGYYYLKATVTIGDTILDTESKRIRLGSYNAKTQLIVSRSLFEIGDTIQFWQIISNPGPLALTGQAELHITHVPTSTVVQRFEKEVTLDPNPNQMVQLTYSWDTAGIDEGEYHVVGYLVYDSKATDMNSYTISTYEDIDISISTQKEFYNYFEKIAVSISIKDPERISLSPSEEAKGSIAHSPLSIVSGRLIRPDGSTDAIDLSYYANLDVYGGWFYVAPAYPMGCYEIEVTAKREEYRTTKKKKAVFIGDYGKVDCDGDGTRNAEDTDDDNDRLPDTFEQEKTGTSIFVEDSDYNGIMDGDEDLDDDGFSNLEEYLAESDPLDPDDWPVSYEKCDGRDNDGDGLVDEEGAEGCINYYKDMDMDGIGVSGDIRCLCKPTYEYSALQGGDPDDQNPYVPNSPTLDISMNLDSGWHMISLPIKPDSLILSDLFPDAVVVYYYKMGSGYVRVQENGALEVGKAYWILLNEEKDYKLTGQLITEYSFSVNEDGWAMIGGCTFPARISGTNCKINVIYRYEQGYGYKRVLNTEDLEFGQGYWVLIKDVIDQGTVTVR